MHFLEKYQKNNQLIDWRILWNVVDRRLSPREQMIMRLMYTTDGKPVDIDLVTQVFGKKEVSSLVKSAEKKLAYYHDLFVVEVDPSLSRWYRLRLERETSRIKDVDLQIEPYVVNNKKVVYAKYTASWRFDVPEDATKIMDAMRCIEDSGLSTLKHCGEACDTNSIIGQMENWIYVPMPAGFAPDEVIQLILEAILNYDLVGITRRVERCTEKLSTF
jgi:hypothetical protein